MRTICIRTHPHYYAHQSGFKWCEFSSSFSFDSYYLEQKKSNYNSVGNACTIPSWRLSQREWARLIRRSNEIAVFLVREKFHKANTIIKLVWLIIFFFVLLQLGFFIYYSVSTGELNPAGPVPTESIFIYRPDKRLEIWRFLFYMLLHAG